MDLSNYWNYFRFFEPATVDLNIFEDIKFTCTGSGHGNLCIADHEDFYLRNKSGEIKPFAFKNNEIIRVLLARNDPTILVFCQDATTYSIYYLNTATFDQLGLVTFPKSQHFSVSSICALHDNSRIAFVSNEQNLVIYSAPYKNDSVPAIYKFNDNITALHFGLYIGDSPILYVITEKEIFSILFPKGVSPIQTKIDTKSTKGVSTINEQGNLIVSRGKQISRYHQRGLDYTYEIDDEPRLMYSFQDYLVVCYNNMEPGSTLIYHPRTHLIFGKAGSGQQIQQIYNVWGLLVLIHRNSTFTFLKPTDIVDKINQLIHNMQFEVAVQIAEAKKLPAEFVANIHYMQGQNYMERNDFQNAVQCYIKTIKRIEPTFIISQFIETSRTEYLIQYLEGLTKNKVATKQHTTLLFNCYTKLRNKEKLQQILQKALEGAKVNREPHFDVDAAISVLIKNNFLNEALQLSHAFQLHTIYLKILMKKKYWSEIISYFREINLDALNNTLREIGSDIMDMLPPNFRSELVDIILQACIIKDKKYLKLKYVQRIFTHHREDLYYILRSILQAMPERMEKFNWNMLIELAIEDPVDDNDNVALNYINYPRAVFDLDLLLITVAGSRNEEAKKLVLEKAGLMDALIKLSSVDRIIELCNLYCKTDVYIWERSLKVVASRNNESDLKKFLSESKKFLTMMEIYKCLKGKNIKFGTVKSLLHEHYKAIYSKNDKLSKDVDEKLKNVQEKQEIEENKRTGFFNTKTAYCDKCHETLELPVRHFLCGHSYHIACLGEVIEYCPICHEKHKKVVSKRVKNLLETDLVLGKNEDPMMDFVTNIATDAMNVNAAEDLAAVKQFQYELTRHEI